MRKSSLWRMLVNIARIMLFFILCMAILLTVARADTAACLRILNYSTLARPYSSDPVLTLLADIDHGRVVRESRFPARTEVSFSPVANRTVYVAADVAQPRGASLIVQGKSGIFSEDQIVQRGMANDDFEYFSESSRRMVWSTDGSRLAYLSRNGPDSANPRVYPQTLSVLNVDTGEQLSTSLEETGEYCCLGTFSPDLKYLTVRKDFTPTNDIEIWSTAPLLSIDPLMRWQAGEWLPNSHEFVGIGYPTTPGQLHFMRWSDTLKTAVPISSVIPRRVVLAAYPSPDGKYVAFQSTPSLCVTPSQGCLQNYAYNIFTIDGELVVDSLDGLQLNPNRSSVNFADPTPNVMRWTPDSKQFLYLHENVPQSIYFELYSFDITTRKNTSLADKLAANYMQDAFFPDTLDRYYHPSAVKSPPQFMFRTRRTGSDFSVDYVSLDGTRIIPMVEEVSLVTDLESPYTGYRRLYGWALDGRTVIVPWLRSSFTGTTSAGVVWMNNDGTGKRELDGFENIGDVNVAVDMTTRLASRWLGFFAARNGTMNFELVSLDDQRRWEVRLPAVGSINGWMTWFSRDGRSVAVYVGDTQNRTTRTDYVFLIDLESGYTERFSNASMAAWSRENDRLALAVYDPLRVTYAIRVVAPDGSSRGLIPLTNYEVTDIRAMSWNPCR